MDTSSDSDTYSVVQELTTGQQEEGEVTDLNQDISLTNTDQAYTEEQTYGETVWCAFLYELDTRMSSAEDNPFAAPKQQPVGKVSVNLPTDYWLCRKMDGLNLTLTQG